MMLAMLFSVLSCSSPSEPWHEMTVSRSHMNAAKCFYLHVSENKAGQMVLTGYCTDENGKEYASEEGIVLTEETVKVLRGLALETLPGKKKKLFFGFDAKDKTEKKLTLYDKKGRKTQKELSDELIEAILDAVINDFKAEISSVDSLQLRLIGMHGELEYALTRTEGDFALTRYRVVSFKSEEEQIPEKTVLCKNTEILQLLNGCRMLRWNGFYGEHPQDVCDGVMFALTAVVNGGQKISAEGSENFPDGYGKLIGYFDRALSEHGSAEEG